MRRTSVLLTASTALLMVVGVSIEVPAQVRGGSRGTATLGAAASVASSAATKAQTLRAEGKSATDAAIAIRAQFGTSAADLASAFLTVGYTAAETAVGLREAYSMNARATIDALARGGFNLAALIKGVRSAYSSAQPADFLIALRDVPSARYGDVIKAVSAEYQLNGGATAQAMRAAATDYAITAEVLRESFGLGVEAVADAMHKGGFNLEDVARALVSSFNASADQIAAALLKAGAQKQAIAQTLRQTLGQNAGQIVALLAPKMNTLELIQAMRAGLGTSAVDMAKLLRARGMSASDFVKSLATTYGLGSDAALSALADAGYERGEQIAAAHRGLNAGIDYAAGYLHKQKTGAATSIQVLTQEFSAGASDVSRALMQAGYKVDEIALGLKQALNYTALQTASVLKDLQYNAAQIGAALTQVFQLSVPDLAQVLASIGL